MVIKKTFLTGPAKLLRLAAERTKVILWNFFLTDRFSILLMFIYHSTGNCLNFTIKNNSTS